MRKMNACWLAGLAALTMEASAQSNVTIYGRLDASINLQRFSAVAGADSTTRKTVSSDTSLWGLRGTEDLGGGMRAFFKLENGYQIDTGSAQVPTKFWNREALVGIGDSRYGSVQLGSQFTPAIWLTRAIDPFIRSNNGANLNLLQGLRGYAVMHDNAVQYISPNWDGLSVRAIVAASEGGPGRGHSLAAEYKRGNGFVAVSYDNIKVPGVAVGRPGVSTLDSQTYALGGTYDLGTVKLHGWVQTNRIDGLSNVNGYMLGTTVPLGPGEIRASVIRRDAQAGNATQSAIGYFHLMSKRTTLYASIAKVDNKGAAAFGMWPGRLDIAAPAPGQDITGLQVGIRHTF
ncbi:porin [Methylibium sp.]|uniref:porin n=1 Tax=Methylibium sp. TaxID=2067992 RepID=UPI003D144941